MTRILIVEDEAIVARDIRMTLERLGYEVPAVAATGEDAVREAEVVRPDLVLMDIRLRGAMNGIDAAADIRSRQQVPVVYLTAHAEPDTLQRAGVTEPFGYLLKPFEERELHAVIEMALYRAQAEARLRSAEADLRRERDELQRLVRERDRTNQELRSKSEEIEQFVYSISHDLKTPLVSLAGYIGLLRENLADGQVVAALEDAGCVERAARRMGDLIRGLLEFSRLGRIPGQPAEVELAHVVEESVDAVRNQLVQAGAVLEVQEGLPRVWADPARLTQALTNLLSNAIKYGCRTAPALLEVGALREGNEVRLFVRDHGPGITEAYHARIFNLFERLDTGCEGTGVGLAVVARVAQSHGGRAWVESTPGQGATFWIALPDGPSSG